MQRCVALEVWNVSEKRILATRALVQDISLAGVGLLTVRSGGGASSPSEPASHSIRHTPDAYTSVACSLQADRTAVTVALIIL